MVSDYSKLYAKTCVIFSILTADCQSAALVIIEPQSSLAKLFAKNPVFLAKIIDHQ